MQKNTFLTIRCTDETKEQVDFLVQNSICQTLSEYIRHLIDFEYRSLLADLAQEDDTD